MNYYNLFIPYIGNEGISILNVLKAVYGYLLGVEDVGNYLHKFHSKNDLNIPINIESKDFSSLKFVLDNFNLQYKLEEKK